MTYLIEQKLGERAAKPTWFKPSVMAMIVVAVLLGGLPKQSCAQQADEEGDVSTQEIVEQEPDAADNLAIDLPVREHMGRALRALAVYQSQLVGLVPKNFRAVEIEVLADALRRGRQNAQESSRARLQRGFYDVRFTGEFLVSDRSELVIEHDSESKVRKPLGGVNLAIESRSPTDVGGFDGLERQPLFETDHLGNLVALIPRTVRPQSVNNRGETQANSDAWLTETKMQFRWTLSGELIGDVRRFSVQLPRTAQTRFVLSAPAEFELTSSRGVLSESPGPPPDADAQSRGGNIRWYVLEAGGLSQFEISARRRLAADEGRSVIVRRESRQYEVDLASMIWRHRLTLETHDLSPQRLEFYLGRGMVTGVSVNSIESDFRIIPDTEVGSRLQVELPGGRIRDAGRNGSSRAASAMDGGMRTTITIEGVAQWNVTDAQCELPVLRLADRSVLYTEPATQVVVAVSEPLGIASWDLPDGWLQRVQTPSQAGETLLFAEGPPAIRSPEDSVWSTLHLFTAAKHRVDSVWNSIEIQSSPLFQLRATTRVRCSLLQTPAPPIRFLVNEDWTVDSVTVLSTGRQVNLPSDGELLLWPTEEESTQSFMEFDLVAHRNLSAAQRRLAIPETWILRDVGQTAGQIVAIHPPKLRRWDGTSVLLQDRIDEESLSEEAKAFLGPLRDSLLIASRRGEIPSLTLQATDVSFSVDILCDVDLQSDQIQETLRIKPQSTQAISTLTVLLGAANNEPYDWSLIRKDEAAILSIPRSSTLRDREDPLGSLTIEIADRDLNEYELVGQRSREVGTQLSVSLPSVRLARNQTGTLSLAEDLLLGELPAGVQRVPTISSDSDANGVRQTFRFDPSLRPEIRLQRASRAIRQPLVWRQVKSISVSSRSEDLVVINADVSSTGAIEFQFDDDLELLSSMRNGRPVEPLEDASGVAKFASEKGVDQFMLKMRRRHSNAQLFRRCELPAITVLGEVIEESIQVRTPPETYVIWQIKDSSETARLLWLTPRHVIVAFGFLGFGLIYLFAWSVARWTPFGLHWLLALFVILLGISLIGWDSQVPLAALAILPVVLAALTHVVTLKAKPIADDDGTVSPGSRLSGESKSNSDRSVDFSVGVMLISVALATATTGNVAAQQTDNQADAASKAIQLIVPISDSHRRVGDKVYLSESDFQQILDAADPDRPVNAVFRSAVYRVNCRPLRDAENEIAAEVFGEFTLFYDREVTRLALPFRAETIRRIEWVVDGESQIIQYAVNSDGTVTAIVPPSRQMQLRITFLSEVRQVEGDSASLSLAETGPPADEGVNDARTTEIRLPIPKIHAAKLYVEVAPPLVVDSLGEAMGRKILEPSLGRYEADLGNQTTLSVRCHIPDSAVVRDGGRIRRSYRIAAGIESTTVECEVEPAMPVAIGDSMQLTILGRRPDAITSGGWQMRLAENGENVERSDAGSLAGGVYRFTRLNAQSQPIRLLWTLRSNLNDPTSTDDSMPLEVPEVFASAQNRSTRTAFAIEPSSDIRVAERASEIEPIDADEFTSQWSGYTGRVDRAFVVSDGFPSFVLLKNKVPPQVVDSEQHLHLTRTQQQLHFRCSITDASESTRRVLISVPSGFRLVDYQLNGIAMPSADWIEGVDDARWLVVGDARVDGRVQIDLLAVASDEGDSVFTIPRFELADSKQGDDRYRITRERGVNVQVQHSLDEEAIVDSVMTRGQLLSGEIPVLSSKGMIEGNLRVRRPTNGDAYSCDQVSVLRYEDGRWTCDVSVRFPRGRIPSYVDLKIPSRWADQLSFDRNRVYGQKQSTDGEMTVVRVEVSSSDASLNNESNTIVFSIGLDSRELSRVTFPDVQVLGKGRRSLLLAVPNRLTQEELRWQPRSVRRVRPSNNWTARFPNLDLKAEDYSMFASDGPTWSISLEQLSRTESAPQTLVGDARVYLGAGRAILFQHFDVIPGTLDAVSFRVPAGSRCIGAWVAGREVDFDTHNAGEGADAESDNKLLRLPMAYSRLPQPIELLVELPATVFDDSDGKTEVNYLCEVVGMNSPAVWISFFQSTGRSLQRLQLARNSPSNASGTSSMERNIELADAIVTCIEDSQDLLAERSREEIRQWLSPWIERFQSISIDSARTNPLAAFVTGLPNSEPVNESSGPEAGGGEDLGQGGQPSNRIWQPLDRWTVLDERLSQLIGSLLPLDRASQRSISIPALMNEYEFVTVFRWKPSEKLPVVERAFAVGPGLQRKLKNSISILTFFLAAALLWPIRSRLGDWVERPVLWLLAVGIVLLMTSPIAFAASYFVLVAGMYLWQAGSWRRVIPTSLARIIHR